MPAKSGASVPVTVSVTGIFVVSLCLLAVVVAAGSGLGIDAIAPLVGGLVGIGCLGSWLLIRLLSPLGRITEAVEARAGGTLAPPLPDARRGDQFGQLARAVDRLTEALAAARAAPPTAADPTETAADDRLIDVLDGMVDAAMRSNEAMIMLAHMRGEIDAANGRVQGMASAVEEMVTSIREISSTSEAVNADAQQAEASAGDGQRRSQDALTTMGSIAGSIQKAAEEVDGLAAASEEIGGIVKEIEDIADQTNLLALNATIEAARAGDAGKGFAVVASEVKTLAGQTSRATEDIRQRIETLRREMDIIVGSMRESVSVVEQGRGAVDGLGESLNAISGEVGHVSGKMAEISSILAQQTAASQDISEGTTTLAGISAKNNADIDRIMSAMDDLNEALSDQVGTFASLGDGAVIRIAKNDHIKFKKTVLDSVLGRATVSSLPDHHECRFGKWYDALDNADLRAHPAYAALVGPHKEVHALGKRAVDLAAGGRRDEAMALMGDLDRASREVLARIDALLEAYAQSRRMAG
jgi:methyl-accepting chemotaxis protein